MEVECVCFWKTWKETPAYDHFGRLSCNKSRAGDRVLLIRSPLRYGLRGEVRGCDFLAGQVWKKGKEVLP